MEAFVRKGRLFKGGRGGLRRYVQEIEEDWPQARWEDTGIVGMKPEKKTVNQPGYQRGPCPQTSLRGIRGTLLCDILEAFQRGGLL